MASAVRCAVLATLAIAVAGVAAAQQKPPAPRPVSEAVQVNVVNVETYVTDRQGRPVTGLTVADFELDEDGKVVTITNFFAARKGEGALPEGSATPGPSPPPAVQGRAGASPVAEEQRLNLVVFIDNGNISQVGRTMVFTQLRKLLKEGLRPGDRVGLVSFDRSLRESQAFTDQPDVALATLERMARESAEGTFIAAEKSHLQRTMARLEGSESVASGRFGYSGRDSTAIIAQSLLQDIDSFNERNYQLYRAIMDGLIRFVDSLAGLPGRKVLLYVSEGLPVRVGEELYFEWQARFPTIAAQGSFNPTMQAARFNITSYFRDVIRHANAGRVTIYTIDAASDRGLEGISGETAAMSAVPGLAAAESLGRTVSMLAFAGATGGTFLPNTPGLGEMLMRMTDDFTSYYSLGYSPTHVGDGKYHRLVVRVKREGVAVRSREGYLDKPDQERLADRTGAALLVAGDRNPLDARVTLGKGRKEKERIYLVPLTVTIPGARLTLLEQGSVRTGNVTICMAVKDEDSRRGDTQCKSFDVAVPGEKFEAWNQQVAVFTFDVRMRKGGNRLAVTARDEVAQAEATLVREVSVPAGKS